MLYWLYGVRNLVGGEVMSRGDKKDYKAATFRLPPDLLKRLDAYSAKNGVVKSFIIEQALREYLDKKE